MTRAFTLIELSIVLIIIGLLVGGVLVGKTLINQAKLHAIINEWKGYEAALYTYKLTYNSLPGDDNNAESFFGASNTNNGNRDNEINAVFGDGTQSLSQESYLVWQHLSLATLISGSYTGTQGAGGRYDIDREENAPSSTYRNDATYCITSPGPGAIYAWDSILSTSLNISERQTILALGFETPTQPGGQFLYSLLPSSDLESLDRKHDDGLAISGRIRTPHSSNNWVNQGSTTGASGSQIYSGTQDPALPIFLMPQ